MMNNMRGCKDELNIFNSPFRKKYRNSFEIIALMLEAVKDDEAARFYLMKYADINSAQLKNYLESLVKMGFIETCMRDDRVFYRATERGFEFLKQYYVLQRMLLNAHTQNKSISIPYEAEYNTPNGQQYYITRVVRRL